MLVSDAARARRAYGGDLYAPLEVQLVEMPACCWYHRSTCCYWLLGRMEKMLSEMYQVARSLGLSERCYTHVADMYCNGCHPNTAHFVDAQRFATPQGERTEIVVSICPSACELFYDACSDFAASRNISSAVQFCEHFTEKRLFAFDDDDDNDDDVVYRVSRTEDNCFFGYAAASGGKAVKQEIGYCLPELPDEDYSYSAQRMASPVDSYVTGKDVPSPRPDWPFPLPPDKVPAPIWDDIRNEAASGSIGLMLIAVSLVLAAFVSLVVP
eukprot:TRINITY_DN1355_c0_g1_i2.p1 TRINITY_DN1355_c0_g1~~TRINITY_DN1355_c0_g1_i2.p1  ORF type:complete len:269 (+),score=72.20 TRINITY_DN1355_c0_g1_i2:97-903(+)